MQEVLNYVSGLWWVLPIVLFIVGWKWAIRIFGIVMIPEDQIGIVVKRRIAVGDNWQDIRDALDFLGQLGLAGNLRRGFGRQGVPG